MRDLSFRWSGSAAVVNQAIGPRLGVVRNNRLFGPARRWEGTSLQVCARNGRGDNGHRSQGGNESGKLDESDISLQHTVVVLVVGPG
jgi:hypothetical protein